MALYKEIIQQDGVPTNYHRILFLQITPNRQNSIAVISYINEELRKTQKSDDSYVPYQVSTTYETDYIEDMSISDAYAFLKKLPEFNGAIDI